MKKLLLLALFSVLLIVPRPAVADQVLIWQSPQYGDCCLIGRSVNSLGQVAFVTFHSEGGVQFDTLRATPPADTGSVTATQYFFAAHDIFFSYLSISLLSIDDTGLLTFMTLHNLCPREDIACLIAHNFNFVVPETLTIDTNPGNGHAMGDYSLLSVPDIPEKLYRIGPTVPEPSTWLLLGSGLAGLALWRRKKAA